MLGQYAGAGHVEDAHGSALKAAAEDLAVRRGRSF